jgi:hypothetical protein
MKFTTVFCVLLLTKSVFAGIACETNATSLSRNIERKCSKMTGSERENCAKKELNLVLPKVKTCKVELEAALNEFLAKGK